MTHTLAAGPHVTVVGGLEQRYHVAGSGPVCIAHSGGPGIEAGYLRMPLLEDHLTIIYLEPIGTGGSGKLPSHPCGYSVERFAQQLIGFIEATELVRPLILGHSHGGFVALQAALDRQDAISGLMLYDSAAFTGADFMSVTGAAVGAFVDRHAGDPAAERVASAWRSLAGVHDDETYTASVRGLLPVYFSDFHQHAATLAAMESKTRATMLVGDGAPFDVRSRLAGLTVPTLILVGAADFILGPRYAEELAALLPHAKIGWFEESGHFAHIEEPQKFASLVAAFARAIA